jgi:hypothetical protein
LEGACRSARQWREIASSHLSGSLWWANQGVTYNPDADEFVFTGAHNLPGVKAWATKANAKTMRVSATNKDLIPPELQERGYSHAGDLDYFDGELWVPIDGDSGDAPARFLVVDPQTLQPRRVVPETGGLPGRQSASNAWAAVRPDTGHICSGPYRNMTTVYCYERSTGALASKTHLSRRLDGVQGGAFRRASSDGALYLGTDSDHQGDNVVYAIDLDTGRVAPQIVAHTGFGSWRLGRGIEFEGLTFMDDGQLLRWYGNPPWWFFWWWFSKPLFAFEAVTQGDWVATHGATVPAQHVALAGLGTSTTATGTGGGGRERSRRAGPVRQQHGVARNGVGMGTGHHGGRYARAGGAERGPGRAVSTS